jgi:hypothetical protein
MGIEVGGTTIYGSQLDDFWTSWTEGTLIDRDDNDDEIWRLRSSEPVRCLDLLMPIDLPVFSPLKIHLDFMAWSREQYDEARASLLADVRRSQEEHHHWHWQKVPRIPT